MAKKNGYTARLEALPMDVLRKVATGEWTLEQGEAELERRKALSTAIYHAKGK